MNHVYVPLVYHLGGYVTFYAQCSSGCLLFCTGMKQTTYTRSTELRPACSRTQLVQSYLEYLNI